ncbi:amino acid adenylation domain-containing protein [Kibdelosporangium banguiense]|uniref:Amino acid adenylation domain-containing protein n=1 Tax=Kibdelosporangium banguiense TaxID=1365924 RepID=A0ABS4TVL6_9PSEU|nr:non-ribosomal peptide synthetase [Kibdelosporangium banguiense]MBP2328444.1 amino acid adenylation domain-containing protein [Kibdelosporangium banguiense]
MIPLSFAQRGLWFLHQVDRDDSAYHIPLVWHISGDLAGQALADATCDLVVRHESLRTVFPETDGQPHQKVIRAADLGPVLTTSHVDAAEMHSRVQDIVMRPFDLRTDIPIRAELLTSDAGDQVLVLVVHHIAGDGWSEEVLCRDLSRAYAARAGGTVPDWPELPVQYADYTLWQRELLGEESDPDSVISRQLAYWRTQLADLPSDLGLPTDHTAAAGAADTSDCVTFSLDAEVHRRLSELAQRSGATMFMIVQAALAALATRLGGGTDLPLGTVVSGRTDEALDDLAGYFTNTLVLRTSTAGDPTFAELVRRAREVTLAGFAHQDVPFEKVVEAVNPARTRMGSPLFQIVFSYSEEAPAELELAGAKVVPKAYATGMAKFDLDFDLQERQSAGIAGRLDYRTTLFDRTTIDTMAAALVRLLTAAANNPEATLSELDILDDTELRRIVVEWNDTATGTPVTGSIQERFAEQATRTPDAVALRAQGSELSYRELDDRSNRMAHRLLGLGVAREQPVAVLMRRSADLIVVLLAIIKAGGAYLPLHDTDPLPRKQFAVDDAGARILLTDEATSDRPRCDTVLVVDADPELAAQPTTAPDVAGYPDQLAYVMYTSGSTGRPKGVTITHRAILDLVRDRSWDGDAHQRVLMVAPYAFDVSTYEIWVPLLRGGRTVVAPESKLEIDTLARLIADEGITAVSLSAGLFHVVAEEAPACLGPLRLVMTGGDVVASSAVDRVLTHNPGITVRYAYGPTETTVQVTQSDITTPYGGSVRVPVGAPMDNVKVYVLDARLQVLPAGVAGELYVSGRLARGYLGRAALSAERFVPNPFGDPGERMYRTGDLARWTPDGRLEFVGRADAQVKVRGFRVELGEIETALARHAGVARAAVLARADRTGVKQLVGYVQPDPGLHLEPADLRTFIAAAVPAYMVPSQIVVLDQFPLTRNGKLDRAALPSPESTVDVGRRPRNPREEILCGLFAGLLGCDEVSIDDDFFARGGHSLLATRLISRVRSALGVELTIRSLFETPTVAGLAQQLKETDRPVLRARDLPDRVPLSFAQQRLWFLSEFEGPSASYNIPIAVRLSGELDVQALRSAMADVVERQEALRTVFPAMDGVPGQQLVDVDAAMAQWGEVACEPSGLSDALAQEARYAFDLANEVPLWMRLFSVAPDEYVLLVLVHHIAGDEWSFGVLWRDLAKAYTARLSGRAPEWTPLPVRYSDYTIWQREMLDGNAEPLRFWQSALAGLPDQLELPTDRRRPAVASGRAAEVAFRIPPEEHRRLADLALELNSTLFMVVQAGWAALLTRLGAGTDIPIGTPVSGRTEHAVEDIVGFFVNTLVLRTDTSMDPTFRELVERVRDTDLAAFANQDAPFERVVEQLNPVRSTSRHPLFQVMLSFHTDDRDIPRFPGLEVTYEDLETGDAKFDLLLDLTEQRSASGAPDGILGTLEYAVDLFDEPTAELMARRLVQMLAQVVADPDRTIGAVPILSPDEEHRLLTEWSGCAGGMSGRTFVGMFTEQAQRTSDAVAVVAPDRELTYAELDVWSDRLAQRLINDGAGPERLIAVLLPRSAALIAAILAVMKTGAAFLPIDPHLPAERIEFMLGRASALAVLTTPELAGSLDVPVVLVGEQSAAPFVRKAAFPGAAAAYVVYTSGSTGRPKGVVVSHDAFADFVVRFRETLSLTAADRVLAITTAAFDMSFTELLSPLADGATVVLADRETVVDPRELANLLRTTSATVLQATPTSLQSVVAEAPEALAGVRVFVGAEPLSADLAASLCANALSVTNLYGPTEALVWSTAAAITAGDGEQPTIGRPLPGVQALVLDTRLRPVPVGVPGELYISREGLARGYAGRPGLTAERFVANPFGAPGTRMYRTGDLVRWSRTGELDFIGRADTQVKIRGFRVELGEIEQVLTAVPDVRRVTVLLREDRPGDKRLVAYYTTDGQVDVDALRDAAMRSLPGYMVPSAFVHLDLFPATPNGKLDRAALPAAEVTGGRGRRPRSVREEVLCGLFAEVLGIDQVGVDDGFFELGGHSLLATTLLSRIRSALGVTVSVRDLFATPTVAGLAAGLGTATVRTFDPVLALRSGGTRAPLFCVPPANGMSWCYSALVRYLPNDLPIYGLQAIGLGSAGSLPAGIDEIADDYRARISRVQPAGPYTLLGWSFGGNVAYEIAARLRRSGHQVDRLIMLDSFPGKSAADRPEWTQRDFLELACDGIGAFDAEPGAGPLPMSRVRELLHEHGSLLAELDAAELASVVRVTENNVRLLEMSTPTVFDGDVHFVEATGDEKPDGRFADRWTPYVGGRMVTAEVPARHLDMLGRQSIAVLGPLVARLLAVNE